MTTMVEMEVLRIIEEYFFGRAMIIPIFALISYSSKPRFKKLTVAVGSEQRDSATVSVVLEINDSLLLSGKKFSRGHDSLNQSKDYGTKPGSVCFTAHRLWMQFYISSKSIDYL